MELSFDGEAVHGGNAARERFYDSRGYGTPTDGGLVLAPVEAAHLLFRGDLAAVVDARPGGDGRLGFRAFLGTAVPEVAFLVYKDLRDRGFYLSSARGDPGRFAVYPRGNGPWDDTVAYQVLAVSERAPVAAATLRGLAHEPATGVLAVADEESEITYLGLSVPSMEGTTAHEVPATSGELLSDRVIAWEPPAALHEQAFYGQRLDRDEQAVQLSLVEAAYLAAEGGLELAGGSPAVVERGQSVEGDRFDRRRRVYRALRTAGIVPKTGFKFGADFRTYEEVTSVDELGHSELLVRVLPDEHTFAPRDLALDVRLAGGVRKQMAFALVGDEIGWLAAERLTP